MDFRRPRPRPQPLVQRPRPKMNPQTDNVVRNPTQRKATVFEMADMLKGKTPETSGSVAEKMAQMF